MRKPMRSAALAGCLALAAVGARGQTETVDCPCANAATERANRATPALKALDWHRAANDKILVAAQPAADYANATYRIGNEEVKLVNGERSVPAAPGSATQRVTRVVGKPVFGKLGSKSAAAVWLVDDPGGSGTFYYVGVSVASVTGRSINAVLLGDRIRPQRIAFRGDQIVATYMDRKPDEPMFAKPTTQKSMTLRFDVAKRELIELKPDAPTRDAGRSDD
jgi:hypothetical protein